MRELPERDWIYLRELRPKLLEVLSRRINDEVRSALAAPNMTEDEKRHIVYELVKDNDRIVADCFDDWRRSRAVERCWSLRTHELLTSEHLENLIPETRRQITHDLD